MNRRRVLFVNHVSVMSGAEYCLLDIATAYRKTSKVILFAEGPLRQRMEDAGVEAKVIAATANLLNTRTYSKVSVLKTIPGLWQMARLIAKESQGFEAIYAGSQKAFVASALATYFGSPPLIWHLRDIITARHFSFINRKIAVILANQSASKVLVVSQATADAFVAAGGRKDLVQVIHDGISSEPFERVIPDAIAKIRKDLGVGDAPLLGTFSRLSYWKGQHILLKALKELPQVHALIVGEALFGEDEYVSQLKHMAAQPDLRERVHWLGFRNDVPTLMAACDIIVHTSTEPEPCARVGVEGLLAGKPVIASATGGMFEIIEDGVTGRLVTPGDPSALAKTICEVLSNLSRADTCAVRGQKHVQESFSPLANINAIDCVIEKVVLEGHER